MPYVAVASSSSTSPDHPVALLLALLRRVVAYMDRIRSAGWVQPADVGRITGFADTTVGLIGTGRIGRSVGARRVPFGFRIVAFDPFIDPDSMRTSGITPLSLGELLRRADAISLHAPLTEANRRLIDAGRLAELKAGAVVVNTSRGVLLRRVVGKFTAPGSRRSRPRAIGIPAALRRHRLIALSGRSPASDRRSG
ncbi:NAD(P)-dependent oxidoreductase [Gryllotalpicola koreensis]|uniref:D-isomer specific 2-hydroxyacid dehydrogenase NAD-binding domain-containing protein n=1 Tax=Gryllotalpicola koreensis TaxID=993086 RepID=A0ABP7ZU97_9MICO